MNANLMRAVSGFFLGAVLITAAAPEPVTAGKRPAPQSAGSTCSYRGVTFPNGATTTFDCPLNPLACYSNAVMLPKWTCREGKWCNHTGTCYAKPFGG